MDGRITTRTVDGEARIRLAERRDAGAVREIYAPIVQESPISFEYDPPSPEEMERRICDTLTRYPWLICEVDGEVAGYAYAAQHAARAAYLWAVDASVYIRENLRGAGVARALYGSLFEILRLQGFYTVSAGITLPNAPSVRLHESLGFRRVGVFEQIGYKHGRWWDLGRYELILGERTPDQPSPPLSLPEAMELQPWPAALRCGEGLLRLNSTG